MRHTQQIEPGKANIIFDVRMPYDSTRDVASGVAAGQITVPQRKALTLARAMVDYYSTGNATLGSYRAEIDKAAAAAGGTWAGWGFGVLVHYASGLARYIS